MRTLLFCMIVVSFIATGSLFAEEKAQEKDKEKKPVQDAPSVQPGYVPRSEITNVEGSDSS